MVAALWGVFIWKEFQNARPGTNRLLALMFVLFIVGLALIVKANS
jgi:glucose uptake protein